MDKVPLWLLPRPFKRQPNSSVIARIQEIAYFATATSYPSR